MLHSIIFIKTAFHQNRSDSSSLSTVVSARRDGFQSNSCITNLPSIFINNFLTAYREDFGVEGSPRNSSLLKKIRTDLAHNTEMVPSEIRSEVTDCNEMGNYRAKRALVLAAVLLL
jgi:hypothetical protein